MVESPGVRPREAEMGEFRMLIVEILLRIAGWIAPINHPDGLRFLECFLVYLKGVNHPGGGMYCEGMSESTKNTVEPNRAVALVGAAPDESGRASTGMKAGDAM